MNKTKIFNDFSFFARDKKKIPSLVINDYAKHIENSYTPYILEERQMNVSALDLFSRLLYERIMFFSGTVDEDSCNIAVAQLLYLNSIGNGDISFYINSHGGSIIDGLQVVDTMNFVKSDISTLCLGCCASMAAVLLSNGTKGKRCALPHSRIMIHQPAMTVGGKYTDIKIEVQQLERCKEDIYKILAKNMNKTIAEVEGLCERDNWFIGEEGIGLGIIDSLI